MPAASDSLRGNPDPFTFGAARPSTAQLTAQLEAQLTAFSDQVWDVRNDEEQDSVHLFVLEELKRLMGQCKCQKIPPPAGIQQAITDLTVTIVSTAKAVTAALLVVLHLMEVTNVHDVQICLA